MFLSAPGPGNSIGQSVSAGRAELIAQPDRWIELGPGGRTVKLQDWFLPQLYQRGEDPKVVVRSANGTEAASSRSEKRLSEFDVFLSHQHASRERVIQIAGQLEPHHRGTRGTSTGKMGPERSRGIS